MKQYLDLLQKIKDEWTFVDDRTGVGTKKIFWAQMKYSLADWFPLVTTKKTFLRVIIVELIRLIRWETNIKYLVDRNVRIRNERPFQNYLQKNNLEKKFPKYSEERTKEMENFIQSIKEKDLSDPFVQERWDLWPVYWYQWRNYNWAWVDQIRQAIDLIKNSPNSRRIIVNAWNPAQIQEMLLPPCHMFFQFNVDTQNNLLHLQMYQRSADMFLWVPFNIASYSTLLILIAKITWYTPWTFTHTLGDTHVYSNHRDVVEKQLTRDPLPLPTLEIRKEIKTLEDVEELEREDFSLVWYTSHGRLKAPVAV